MGPDPVPPPAFRQAEGTQFFANRNRAFGANHGADRTRGGATSLEICPGKAMPRERNAPETHNCVENWGFLPWLGFPIKRKTCWVRPIENPVKFVCIEEEEKPSLPACSPVKTSICEVVWDFERALEQYALYGRSQRGPSRPGVRGRRDAMTADVVIVGAGLAGLGCACELNSRGLSCLLVEASDGVGGRARTDAVDGFLLDRGFQVLLT